MMLLLSLSIRKQVRVIDQLVFLPGTFHSFRQEEKGELLAKNIARTARSEYSRSRYVLSAESKAEADNTYRELDYLGYQKSWI